MADATLFGLYRSYPFNGTSSTPSLTNFTLDATNDAVEAIVQAYEAATITQIGVRLGVKTGTTPTYRVSLQGVGSTGLPDGTIKGATNNALATFSPSGLGWADGSWNWLTLTESYTCSRGEWLALVIDYSSGTVSGAANASFTTRFNVGPYDVKHYIIENNATVRTRREFPVTGYASASKVYGLPVSSVSTQGITAASSPREVGCRFTTNASWGSTFQVVGVRFLGNLPLSGGTTTIRLYDGGAAADTTVLQDITINNEIAANTVADRVCNNIFFNEATLATLTFGNTYRVSFESSASTATFYYVNVAAAGDLASYPGGSAIYWTQRDSGGNWSDTTTRRMFDFDLILSDWTEPQGGAFAIQGRRRRNQTIYRM